MTTIKDVAKASGVSIATVSYVINQSKPVRESTRLKVEQAMKELSYSHNKMASALKSRAHETKVIAFMIPDHVNPFFSELIREVEAECKKQGYIMMLCHVTADLDYVSGLLGALRSRQVDGVLYTTLDQEKIGQTLKKFRDMPSILIDFEFGDSQSQGFEDNDVLGGYIPAKYLLSLGHKHIACVTGPEHMRVTKQRLQGFKSALEEFDVPFQPQLIIDGQFEQKGGYDAFMKLYSKPPVPTAIISHSDVMAFGIQSAAYQVGMRIPEDFSLIGYDNIGMSKYACPPLTTMNLPVEQIAEQAVYLLLEKIKGRVADRAITIEPQLVLRQSVMKHS